MKIIRNSLFLLLLLCSFNTSAQVPEITTALKIVPLTEFHSHYRLDTLLYQDTLRHYTAEVYFPYSATDARFNQAMSAFIKKQLQNGEPLYLIQEETTFSMWVLSYEIAGDLVGFNFIYQTYTQGAAHFLHGFSTFNFDTRENRVVKFKEVIRFSIFNSGKKFCKIINESQPHAEFVKKDFLNNTDFFLTYGDLCLCFDDQEKSVSMISFAIGRDKIKKYFSAKASKRYSGKF